MPELIGEKWFCKAHKYDFRSLSYTPFPIKDNDYKNSLHVFKNTKKLINKPIFKFILGVNKNKYYLYKAKVRIVNNIILILKLKHITSNVKVNIPYKIFDYEKIYDGYEIKIYKNQNSALEELKRYFKKDEKVINQILSLTDKNFQIADNILKDEKVLRNAVSELEREGEIIGKKSTGKFLTIVVSNIPDNPNIKSVIQRKEKDWFFNYLENRSL